MAEIHGKVGAVYRSRALIVGTGIAFNDSNPDTITDSGNGFITAGFANGMKITVSGSTSNDGDYQIEASDAVSAGELILIAANALTGEEAGDVVTITESARGNQLLGFTDWSLNLGVELKDVTDFEDGATGYRTRLVALSDWTARARGFWLSDTRYNLLATDKVFRFFLVNSADPTATTSWYYEGRGIVDGIPVNCPTDEVVRMELSFQGNGALTLIERSIAWP